MTDIITRLHTAVITEVNPIDELTYPTNLGLEAAEEIERLRAALREAKFAIFSSDMTIKDRADQAIRLALK